MYIICKSFGNCGNVYAHQYMTAGIFPDKSDSEQELKQRCLELVSYILAVPYLKVSNTSHSNYPP